MNYISVIGLLTNINIIYIVLIHVVIIGFIVYFIFNSRRRLTNKSKEYQSAINQLMESQSKLKKINATKDKLFSIIAHDLKSPFNALLGFSEILNNNLEILTPDKVKKYAGIINETARDLFNQTENLLEWSRAQTNKIKFNPQKIDLHMSVLNVFAIYELTAYNKNIELISDIKSSTFAMGDMNIVTTILRNLIDNAIKYTRTGGFVKVNVTKKGSLFEISVSDNGIGIKKENFNKLFDINESISTKGTLEESGTGLGLLLCKDFVEISGGRIFVSSIEGEGSTFIFTLPTVD